MKRKILTVIQIILIGIFIFSSYKIASKLYAYKKDGKTYEVIQEEYEKAERASGSDSIDYEGLYNKFKEANSDYVYWIKVENTNIDYPVVKGEDNSFYLKHDFNKNSSSSGCIFMDYENDIEKDQNLIIYGHNMRNGTMFMNLQNYKEADFFKQNNKIILMDANGEHVYEVFAVYVLNSGDSLGNLRYKSQDDFLKHVDFVRNKSFYKSDVEVKAEDKTITLVTCTYEIDDARTVVEAKEIK